MMQFYRTEDRCPSLSTELIGLMMLTETATIGHVEHTGFVSSDVRPVFPGKVAGSAVTVAAPGRDGTIIYKAVDVLGPGDILVISRVDGDDIACVGGGVATAVKAKGGAGIVIDGPCTDVAEIVAVGLPVWCRGHSAKTTNRVFQIGGSVNEPIACGRAAILPGFAVLADDEGVFAAPAERMETLCRLGIERQRRSAKLRTHLAAGRSVFEFNPEAGR
ncbi:4-hydroxy-4-methyl-2-oxoglutarate aldolase/4-carboxy-4-hydroxy-2-oxoadipate aldolase [Ensifer adhaerens]|uniref:RraA family protein n=1 Tax=Ensifer adhaerens TaxID=106592 RepID=UPI001568387D|nr:RraA family protein [Ensifer adhaerens]NRP21826.1 4-hydroxy-4-methyl-2-oxoglutarate aldolase/4-carboxy-4-hydroxy-2-oxoadipate aldolase [Ensifer adhaerens]